MYTNRNPFGGNQFGNQNPFDEMCIRDSDWIDLFIRTPFGGVDEGMRKEIIADAVERLRDKLFRDGKWFSDYVRIRGRAVATVKT